LIYFSFPAPTFRRAIKMLTIQSSEYGSISYFTPQQKSGG
jgi:hypothetical protein